MLGGLNPLMAAGNDTAKIGETNEHRFLSAVQSFNKRTQLQHEVCNLSENSSGFVWEKAGLAVDALDQLQSYHCARRTQYDIADYKVENSTVRFQDSSSGQVETIFKCHQLLTRNSCDEDLFGTAARAAMSFSLLMNKPDENNYVLDTIYLGVQEGDGVVNIRMVASDGVTKLALILDQNQVNLKSLVEAFEDEDLIEVNTFGFFRKTGKISETLISRLFKSESPTIFFKKNTESALDFNKTLRSLKTVGDAISLAVIKNTKIVASSETHLPTPSD